MPTKKQKPMHPGEVLLKEFLEPLNLPQKQLLSILAGRMQGLMKL